MCFTTHKTWHVQVGCLEGAGGVAGVVVVMVFVVLFLFCGWVFFKMHRLS